MQSNRQIKLTKPALNQRNESYLEFIRAQFCIACDHSPVDAHHARRLWSPVSMGGMSQKGSDYCAVPLCRQCHADLHQIGAGEFQRKHAIDLDKMIVFFLIRFIEAARNNRPPGGGRGNPFDQSPKAPPGRDTGPAD